MLSRIVRLMSSTAALYVPSLSLNFLSGQLDSRITFTRGSNATLTDITGKVIYAPANLLTYSEQFDNAAWTKTDTTVSANNVVAPDGTNTADTLTEGSAGTGQVGATGTVSIAGTTTAYSIYLRRVNTDFVRVQVLNGANGFRAWFNLNSGSVGTSGAVGTGTLINASILSAGNGWYRCILVGSIPAVTAYSVFTNTAPADNSSVRVSGGSYAAWGAQLEPVTYQTTAGAYNATTVSAYYGPRFDYDPVTLQPRGLLIEEQRTNLLLRSEELDNASWAKARLSVSANATISPDGTADADKLVEDTSVTLTHVTSQNFTVTAATNYTASVYLKAAERNFARLVLGEVGGGNATRIDVNLSNGAVSTGTSGTGWTLLGGSATAVGNGWYRVTLSGTSSSSTTGSLLIYVSSALGTISYTGNGTSGIFAWGAQVEAGSFATSYIPTVASQVTRSAEVATMTGTNFSSWYNATEGTLVANFATTQALASVSGVASISDGTSSNEIFGYYNTTAAVARIAQGGVQQASLLNAAVLANNAYRFAIAYRLDDFASSLSGGSVVTDTAGTIPTVNRLTIGSRGGGINTLNGCISQISYYSMRLPNTQLQGLTA